MKRRSIRNFKDKKVPEHIIEKLLNAAINAPSGGNIQPISIILVQGADERKKLSEIVGNQPWVKNSPLSMVFCIDFYKIKVWSSMFEADFKGENAISNFLIAYADLFCSAQNVVILAETYQLGSAYIGTIQNNIEKACKYFLTPNYVLPMIVLTIGYPKSIPKNIPKLNRNMIIHNEKYKVPTDSKVKMAFEKKYGTFSKNVDQYFKKAFIEVLEADKQQDISWKEHAKKEMEKLQISNNAQFLFKLRYPSKVMLKMNKSIFQAFKNAGFDFFLNT